MASTGIVWKGIDSFGYKYGYYDDGSMRYRVAIANPGREPSLSQMASAFISLNKRWARCRTSEALKRSRTSVSETGGIARGVPMAPYSPPPTAKSLAVAGAARPFQLFS